LNIEYFWLNQSRRLWGRIFSENMNKMNSQSSIINHQSSIQKVVVIAASAGGIDALTQVFRRLSADLPAAIMVVQHLRSGRPTHLPEHLDRLSYLRVCLAQHGMPLEPGVIYIAEPGMHLSIKNNTMVQDAGAKVNYLRPSADTLFISAAKTYGSRVIGVILSGTGRDGTQGCKEIKAKGGVTIAQNGLTSKHFGMPQAAIEADVIDYVLPLTEIAGKIIELTGV
jgi:two-component system, chemotaxis family, protein-glutamate methylesterase/glutaminase